MFAQPLLACWATGIYNSFRGGLTPAGVCAGPHEEPIKRLSTQWPRSSLPFIRAKYASPNKTRWCWIKTVLHSISRYHTTGVDWWVPGYRHRHTANVWKTDARRRTWTWTKHKQVRLNFTGTANGVIYCERQGLRKGSRKESERATPWLIIVYPKIPDISVRI